MIIFSPFIGDMSFFFLLEEYQGVSIGGGIGSISDILDAAQMICKKVCLLLHCCSI
jgi:hypothetical protein